MDAGTSYSVTSFCRFRDDGIGSGSGSGSNSSVSCLGSAEFSGSASIAAISESR